MRDLAEMVKREGFVVGTAGTLRDGRRDIADAAPDIVLVDLFLPDGSAVTSRDVNVVKPTGITRITPRRVDPSAGYTMTCACTTGVSEPRARTRTVMVSDVTSVAAVRRYGYLSPVTCTLDSGPLSR